MLAPILIVVSALLFVWSLLAFAVLEFPTRWETVPFQVWLHVGIVLVIVLGALELNHLRKARVGAPFGFFRGFPLWLIPLGLLAILLVVPMWSPSQFNLGTTPQGERVHKRTMYERDGKYFIRLNDTYTQELSRQEYMALEREGRRFFARIWILGSYLALALWHYVWRWRRALDGTGQPVAAKPKIRRVIP